MAIQKRPDEKIFASKAGSQEVSAFPDVERGWGFTFEQTGGIPTMEHFNALFKRIDEHFNYMLQRGLPEWSATLDYPVGAYVQYDNKTYRAKKASKNQRPDVVDSTYWVRWSIDYKEVSDFIEEAGKKGVPIGAIVSFPKGMNPRGYLRAIGGTFNRATYPDLYVANGNSDILPNLHRSDVGMTAYFPFDDIPDGWIAFDSIRSTVTQQNYPELYQYLVDKYGSISNVPLAEDRFIRNAAKGLNIGQIQNDAIRNIKGGIDATYGDKSVLYTEASGAFIAQDVGVNRYSFYTSNHMYRAKDIKFDASLVVPTADENRPKSIVFKLCIKAHNTFDDVQFWIKAFGVVENVGRLDAGRLAQDIQQVSVKNQQLEDSFNQNKEQTSLKIQQIENQLNEKNQSGVVWSGNVTQHSTNVIQLSESILNKTVIFYLQQSQSHSLSQNVNVHIASLYVDGGIMDAVGKKYCHGGLYVGGWKNCQIEILSATQIRIVDLSGMYLKKITVA
ncbi:tail fiber protein [Pasteurella canis]|uniref:tail fiber protein n=1 Tax=Pasteurella canis TaxID=753 RepID=UPI000D98F7E2|nr:tail fiber protein [Pasteurella canis]SPY33204.1 Phage Tail Collar Domain [Pasteurella canis]